MKAKEKTGKAAIPAPYRRTTRSSKVPHRFRQDPSTSDDEMQDEVGSLVGSAAGSLGEATSLLLFAKIERLEQQLKDQAANHASASAAAAAAAAATERLQQQLRDQAAAQAAMGAAAAAAAKVTAFNVQTAPPTGPPAQLADPSGSTTASLSSDSPPVRGSSEVSRLPVGI
jgi:mevalonate pyrophosphate decarboxylase